MKPPRVSIATLMGIVVLVALDLAAYQAVDLHSPALSLAICGGVPMANVLLIGLARLATGPLKLRERPVLVAFLGLGSVAWVTFLALVLIVPGAMVDLLDRFLESFIDPFSAESIGPTLLILIVLALLIAPQLAVALLGLALGRWYGSRRTPATTPSMLIETASSPDLG